MKKGKSTFTAAAELRHLAEKKLAKKQKREPQVQEAHDALRLVHELQVHQIELEMQNQELLRYQAEMEAGLARYSDLYDFAPVGYFTLDLTGKILQVNLTGAQQFGVERSKLVGKGISQFVYKADQTAFHEFLATVFESREKASLVFALQNGDRPQAWVHITAIVNEERSQCHTVVTDITERKKAQEKLLASEQRFRRLFDEMPISLWEEDFSSVLTYLEDLGFREMEDFDAYLGQHPQVTAECAQRVRVTAVNKATLALLQAATPDDLLAGISKTFTEKSSAVFSRQLVAIWKGQTACEAEAELKTLGGEPRFVVIRWSVEPDSRQDLSRVFVSMTDITERKRTEEALQNNEANLRKVLDSTPFPVAIVDSDDDEVFFWSRSATERFGHTPPTAAEWYRCAYPDPDYQREVIERWKPMLALARESGLPVNTGEYQVTCADGSIRTCELYASFVNNNLIVTFNDVTEKNQAAKALRESEDKFRYLFDHSAVGKSITLPSGEVQVNKAFCDMLGYFEEDVQGLKWQELSHPEDIEKTEKSLGAVLSGEKTAARFVKRYIHKDGSVVWADVSTSLRRDDQGQPVYFLTTISDVTERVRAEEALLRSEEDLKSSQQIAHVGSWYLDIATNQVEWSDELYRMYGFDPSLPPPPYTEHQKLFTPESWTRLSAALQKTVETGVPYELELETLREDGSTGWMWVHGQTVLDAKGAIVGLRGAVQDITVRKQSEIEINKAREKAETYLNLAGVMFVQINADGTVGMVNPKACKVLGYEQEEIVGKNWFDLCIPEEIRPTVKDVFSKIIIGDMANVEHFENAILTKDGTERIISWHSTPLYNEDGSIYGSLGSGEDITTRKKTEEELRRYEWLQEKEKTKLRDRAGGYRPLYSDPTELNISRVILDGVGKDALELMARDILDLMDTCVTVYEANGDYAYAEFDSAWCQSMDNASFKLCDCKDAKEALSSGKWLCHENCWNDSAKTAMESGQPTDIECVGGIRLYAVPIRAGDEIIGAVNIGYSNPPRDDKTIRELAKKFEFDFDLLRMLSNQYKPRPEFIINVAKNRCNSMARMIGQSVEKQRFEQEKAKLEEQFHQSQKMESIGRLAGGVAHDFNNLLTVILNYTSLIQMRLQAGDPMLEEVEEIDAAGKRAAELTGQLLAFSRKQIIAPKVMNLNTVMRKSEKLLQRIIGEDIDLVFTLADDLQKIDVDPGQVGQVLVNLAVNARDAMPDGGKLLVETRNIILDQHYTKRHPHMKFGPYVMLTISDTGFGMEQQIQDHIFEPFYTTKGVDKGTGLGLSTVYGIVKQSEGSIEVYSEVGHGTVFKIFFPVAKREEEEERSSGTENSTGGNETILLIEDEGSVRKVAKRILEAKGYRILEAAHPGEALILARQHGKSIDLALTDVVMPNMSGKECYEQLCEIVPGIRVLFMSGYTADAMAHQGVLEEGTQFIQKPFSIKDLAGKVREVLDMPS